MARATKPKTKPVKDKRTKKSADVPRDPLTPKQHAAVLALLLEQTVEAAADHVGVGRSTLYRWLGEAAFQAAVSAAYERSFWFAAATLKRRALDAVLVLAQEMNRDNGEPNLDRVSVADKVLTHALRFADLVEIRGKIAALEQALRAEPPGVPPTARTCDPGPAPS